MTKDEQIKELQKVVKRLKTAKTKKIETTLMKALEFDPAKEYVLVMQRGCMPPEEAVEIRIPNIKWIVIVDDIANIKAEEKEVFKKQIYEKEIPKT